MKDYRLVPSVDYSKCISCIFCTKYCPSLTNVHASIYSSLIKVVKACKFKNIYFAWARNSKIRYRAASGGVITAFLLYLLEHRLIDYALVTTMKGLLPRSLLASHREDLISAMGSIYFKTFTLAIVDKILKMLSKGHRVAIVGLPCMINSLKDLLWQAYNENMIFLGLMCYHINDLWYLMYILSRFKPKSDAIPTQISSRGFGWPGSLVISYKSKQHIINVKVNEFSLWNLIPIFELTSPLGCLYCVDHAALEADIVFCDAWHPKFLGKDMFGTSIVGIRSTKGYQLFKEAIKTGYIEAISTSLYDMFYAQRRNFVIRPLQTIIRKAMMYNRNIKIKMLNSIFRNHVLFFAFIEELLRSMTIHFLTRLSLSKRFVLLYMLEKLMYMLKIGILEEKIFQSLLREPKRLSTIFNTLQRLER